MNQSKRTKANVRNQPMQSKQKQSRSKNTKVNPLRKSPKMNNLPRPGKSQGIVGVASSFVSNRSTFINRTKAPFSPHYGDGVKVTGRQYLTSIITTATDSQLFSGNAASTINQVLLSPDALNGRLALEARTYSRYLFTKVRLIYTPRVSTTQAGEFTIGYYADGAANFTFTPSFASIQESEMAFVSSFHNGGQQLLYDIDVPMGAQDSYYCELDTATQTSVRASVQGQILGFPDITSIGAVTQGNLAIEYEILLYCPVSDLGFTLRCKDQAELDIVSKYRDDLRKSFFESKEPESEDDFPDISCSTANLITRVLAKKASLNTLP